VAIDGGLTVVEATHDGESNFQVYFVDDSDYDSVLVNEIGAYEGETAELLDAGDYQLDVEADGDWSIDVRQPRAASGDAPGSHDDSGPEVFGPFEFGGSHIATSLHSGESNFQVYVLPSEGDWPEVVVNEIGTYDGETTFRFDGVGYVAVQADGNWSLDLE
jgi:hypothetical protein